MVKTGFGLVLGLLALGAAPLAAGTASGTMAVTATVEESCRIGARSVDFGAMPEEHGRIDAQSSVTLTCTPAASYVVTMDDGRNGAQGARRMANARGTGFLAYQIYSDAARTRPWGTSASDGVSGIAPAGGQIDLAVYARLDAGPAPAGTYADTITVTVAF